MDNDKFDKKDYEWRIKILKGVIGLLVLFIITIFSVKLSSDSNLVNIISIGAGLVSIALALVAIQISLKQDSNATITNTETRNLLNTINSNMVSLRNEVNNIKVTDTSDGVRPMNKDEVQDLVNKISKKIK